MCVFYSFYGYELVKIYAPSLPKPCDLIIVIGRHHVPESVSVEVHMKLYKNGNTDEKNY